MVFLFIVIFIFLFVSAIWGISQIVGGVGRVVQRKPVTPIEQRPTEPALSQPLASAPLQPATSTTAGSPDAATRLLQQLQKIGELHQQGVLTSEEFSQLKTKLISEF